MFNFNKKKFLKILSPINTLLDNFFGNFKSSNKHAPIKKKFNEKKKIKKEVTL
mgnify:CR=1 FL=1